jgi:D-alanyl-D-alanine carboxypeptidase
MRHRPSLHGLFVGIALAASLFGAGASANPSLLFDLKTGTVLSHEDAFRRWYPASLTKLMTVYVTFQALRAQEVELTSPIRVTKSAAKEPPSKMGYKPGSVMTLDNALKMMIIKSANDIAAAVGENIGGSREAFVARMNAEAARLGMSDTHFANPNGLYSQDQYTTARDLALLVSAIRGQFPEFASYFSIEALTTGKKMMKTYNTLVGRFDGADGMKTGFVCQSGYNLIASATRGDRTLVAIVLGARSGRDRAEKAADLLGKAFETPNAVGTPIAALQPDDVDRDQAMDMRPLVCGKQQPQSESTPLRDENGRMVFKSPYLRDMDREPRKVAIGLGGATGRTPPAFDATAIALEELGVSKIPVPTPRPDYPARGQAVGDSSAAVKATQAGAL